MIPKIQTKVMINLLKGLEIDIIDISLIPG